MARKALPPAEQRGPDFVGAVPAEVAEGEILMRQTEAAEHLAMVRSTQDSALEVGRLAGRIESMLFMRSVGDRMIAETFIQLREGKKYKDLLIDDGNGNLRPSDLKEACRHLFGKSYSLCAELAQNHEALGAELYDKAQQIGLQTKDYRAIRALPADDQTLVQHTIETASDRETVAELIGELTERHAKKLAAKDQEIEAAKAAMREEHAERLAAEKLLAEKRNDLDKAKRDLVKAELRTPTWDERTDTFKREIGERQTLVDKLIGAHLEAINALDVWYTQEVCNSPDYDPEAAVSMPPAVQTVLLTLSDAIDRSAHLVAALQNELHTRFGADLEDARRHLLQTPDAE